MTKIRPSAREAIIEAAFQTFNRQQGASLGDVAEAAGVGRATLHRYFRSREVLINALALTAIDELKVAVDAAVADAASHTDGLRRALAAIIPLAERQWFLAHEPVEQDPSIAQTYESDQRELRESIEAAKSEGTFATDIPTEWIAITYENLIYGAWTLVRDGHATPGQAADMAWRTLVSGCGVAQ